MDDPANRGARRRFLKVGTALVGSAALAASAVAADAPRKQQGLKKRPKESVGYRDEPYLGRTCSKCVLYQGNGNCVIIDGEVSPNGWCTQWVPNTMG